MKKLLLSIALLSGAVMAANAELYFQFEGENLENGETLNYEGYEYVPVLNPDGSASGMYQFKVDPEIHIVSTTEVTASVSATANIGIQLCAGGECEKGTSVTKPAVALAANTPLNLQFDWVADGVNFGEDVEIPAIQAKLTATAGNETITLNVNMGGFTAGVESLGASLNKIYVSGKTLNYDLSNAAQLSLYSLSGKTILHKSVSGNGSVSLANLPSGVYLYRLAGKENKSGKFIIK